MSSSVTASYRSSAVSASASISKAIRDERYEDLPELLEAATADAAKRNDPGSKQPPRTDGRNPLWEANSRGCTPMHVAAMVSPSMPLEWWNRILGWQERSPIDRTRQEPKSRADARHWKAANERLWTRRMDPGQTVVEIFFQTALDPLPWSKHSLKERAKRLRSAMARILEESRQGIVCKERKHGRTRRRTEGTSELMDRADHDERDSLLEQLKQMLLLDDNANQEESQNDDTESDLGLVVDFWRKLRALVLGPREGAIVHALAGLPWCPELVGRLAMALSPAQANGVAENARILESDGARWDLPLHECVRSASVSLPPVPCDRGMLPLLCEAHPVAAAVPDPEEGDRLPLHVSLVRGHSWEASLRYLFASFPSALAIADPVTSLPAFCMACDCLAATVLPSQNQHHNLETIAKAIHGNSLCWTYMYQRERDKALRDASDFLDRQRLTAMYEVLRKDPSVLTTDSKHRVQEKYC